MDERGSEIGGRRDRGADRWCILRTSGGKTLALARSLSAAGIEAWTPMRTFKRPKPGRASRIDGRKQMIEIEAPILPTFVFARARHLTELSIAAGAVPSPHPAFSVFTHAGRAPLVANRDIAGLQEAEKDAARITEALREAESRDEKRRIRAQAATNERARRQALQAERSFNDGDAVLVDEASAFAGMSGVVLSSRGKSAVVQFGGSLKMTIETWQLLPLSLGPETA